MEYEIIKTGLHLTEEELNEIRFCQFDPNASKYGPKKTKESYEVLQEIAKSRGLPNISDMYGMATDNEIVCRDMKENRRQLKSFLESKLKTERGKK